jgi:rhodanese-related sulfurtransferase
MFPKETLVYAGHDRTGILFSTLEVELHKNPILTAPSLQAFVEAIPPARGMRVTKYDQESLDRMRFNQADSQESGDFQELRSSSWQSNRPISVPGGGFGSRNDSVGCGTSSINVEKFSKKLAERASGVEFLDVREPSEFDSGHIPGMRNVALSDLGDEVPRLRSAKRVYLSCLSGIRSTLAAKTLAYIGVKDVVVVNGGFQAWNHAGFSVEEKSS